MRFLSLLFLATCLLFSCKPDGGSANTTVSDEPIDIETLSEELNSNEDDSQEVEEVKLDEAISQQELAKKMLKEAKSEKVDEVAKVENRTETKLVGKTPEQIAKEEKMKLEATKEAIEKSANKGMSCEQMLEDQSKLVDKFATSKDIKIIRELVKKQNDPFFQECMKVESFAVKVEELQTRLDEVADQD